MFGKKVSSKKEDGVGKFSTTLANTCVEKISIILTPNLNRLGLILQKYT